MPAEAALVTPAVVLDTNAVLDWLVFHHPACAGWTRRFAGGAVRWIASAPMRTELVHVLARDTLSAWHPAPQKVWEAWQQLAEIRDALPPSGAACRVRCTDPDDQKFIDLALAHGARWLISRDRAVLRLARRTRPLGLDMVTPESWAESFPGG